MNLRPLGDRILVKRTEEADRTEGGIIIPSTAQEKPHSGEVIETGPGRTLDDGSIVEPRVKRGDHILFGRYAGNEFKLEGVEHIILREDEILGVLED